MENNIMNQKYLQFFISYSHSDMRIKEKLLTALNVLKYEFSIGSIWHDGEISAGNNIDNEVLKHLNESDVILLLVSQNFINSYYCIEVELKKAIKRMNKKECVVIPVILSECSIPDTLSFANLKRLPTDGHPICSRKYFQNQTIGCNDVVVGLRKKLTNDFPNFKLKKKQMKISSAKDNIHIELFKNGIRQQIPVTQDLILQIPKYHKSINDFRTMMEQTLIKSKQLYSKEYKKYKKLNKSFSNDIKLKFLRMFLMDICSYTKVYITDSIGIKVHFRVSKNDNYLGLIASTDNDDNKDLSSDWTVLMTVIPIYKGLIYHSYKLHAPLLKSLNPKLNYKGQNDKIWKDYVTFTFDGLSVGQTPLISYCISVHKDYYDIKGDVLKILAYLNFGDIIEKFICDYCKICKSIDKVYDLKSIVASI